MKKLELAIAGLREQAAALALSEDKAAEKAARAEARAAAAEAAESELRKAVEAIKYDFEVRQRVGLGSVLVSLVEAQCQRQCHAEQVLNVQGSPSPTRS